MKRQVGDREGPFPLNRYFYLRVLPGLLLLIAAVVYATTQTVRSAAISESISRGFSLSVSSPSIFIYFRGRGYREKSRRRFGEFCALRLGCHLIWVSYIIKEREGVSAENFHQASL
jgi:hypothetical protein